MMFFSLSADREDKSSITHWRSLGQSWQAISFFLLFETGSLYVDPAGLELRSSCISLLNDEDCKPVTLCLAYHLFF